MILFIIAFSLALLVSLGFASWADQINTEEDG